jgi:hypothetical protein
LYTSEGREIRDHDLRYCRAMSTGPALTVKDYVKAIEDLAEMIDTMDASIASERVKAAQLEPHSIPLKVLENHIAGLVEIRERLRHARACLIDASARRSRTRRRKRQTST